MILADKIIEERKKLGLSQEELAEKLSVSRQAVSKWESAQSIPDLQKIIMMSELFSVSTDYLLKDDAKQEVTTSNEIDALKPIRRVSIEEANSFLDLVKEQSKTTSLGVMLCILSPALLIFLAGMAEDKKIKETLATAIGLSTLFILVAIALFFFITNSIKKSRFNYLEKEIFETAYGVSGLVKEREEKNNPTYIKFLTLGVILCVLSPLPLLIVSAINDKSTFVVSSISLLFVIVSIGVYLIVRASLVKSSYDVLLQENDYEKSEKKNSTAINATSVIYWCIATAIFLAWSFISNDWNITWIIWPIVGVLFAPFVIIVKHINSKKNK